METIIPKTSVVLSSLLRADFTTQWRNRRAVILTLIVPGVIILSWKGLVATAGGPFVLSNAITIGLFASGLMGYSNTIARDRDKGIFQRLRVTPIPSWAIMGSRLFVQLVMIMLITTVVFILGKNFDNISLSPVAYVVSYFTAVIGGLVSLSLGQMIVGFIKNPETVNSTTRLVYIGFIVTGMFGEMYVALSKDPVDKILADAVHYSPYGAVKTILSTGMEPSTWNAGTTTALLVAIGYTMVFTFLGIKWFKWNTK